MQKIDNVTFENNDLTLISFTQEWDQDDIKYLADLVFGKIQDHRIIEHIKGADREYTRFNFADNYLILHFESYSNACWIEAEDQLPNKSLEIITALLQALKNSY